MIVCNHISIFLSIEWQDVGSKVPDHCSSFYLRCSYDDRTADVTYCAVVTLFLHAASCGLSLTAAFSLRRYLAFHCFACHLASFSRYKTAFLASSMPPKHAEQDKIDVKWLKKVNFLT